MTISDKPSHPTYRLAAHVCACAVDSHIVLLDLHRNRYLGVDDVNARLLQYYVVDWPMQPALGNSPVHDSLSITASNSDFSSVLHEMITDGILTRDVNNNNNAMRTSIKRPDHTLIQGYLNIPLNIVWIDVVAFLYACGVAKALLKWKSLEYITTRVRSRRSMNSKASRNDSQPEENYLPALQRRLAIFRRLRPVLFTAADQCLFNSLALSEYFAHYNLYPHWIFGVASKPFRAHCWLQHENIVIDDTPDNVNNFSPIMVV